MISINERSNEMTHEGLGRFENKILESLESISAIRVDTGSEYGTIIDLLSETGKSYGRIAESDDDMRDLANAYDKRVEKPLLIGITESELLEYMR